MTLNANLSSSWTFDPNLGEIVIGAFARCGVRRTELTAQHMADARFEANMVQSEMAGEGINLWQVELVTQDLVAGQGVYTVPDTTLFVLDVYIRQNPESALPTDRIILPISRTDWASTSNKSMTGFPTSYWWDRLLSPTLTLWPVPNQDISGGLRYYIQKRAMDANLQNGVQVQIPFEAYDYFTWALALRLAVIYASDKLPMLMPLKQSAYQKYLQASTENVPINMAINIAPYFRI